MHLQVALSDTGIPKVNVSLSAASDEEPEVDVSNEEFLQFDTGLQCACYRYINQGNVFFV